MKPVLLALPLVVWDFAVSDHGLVCDGDTKQWEHGVPTTGPGGTHPMWATRLHGQYYNDSVDHLVLALPDLGDLQQPSLRIRHWGAFGPGDAGWFETLVGGTWQRIDPVYGYPVPSGFTGTTGWLETTVPIQGASGFRFVFASDAWWSDAGWYVSSVELHDGDVTEPRIELLSWPVDTQELTEPYTVRAKVFDDVALETIHLVWSTPSGSGYAPMQAFSGGVFEGSIPAQHPDTTVSWHIEASDAAGNLGATDPTSAFRVFLAPPRNFAAHLGDRAVGQVVDLSWSPPLSPHPVLGYVVQDADAEVEPFVAGSSPTKLDLRPGYPARWRVAAIYEAGVGDWSNTLHLEVEQPSLTRIVPSTALQGRTFHLRIEGGSLYLVDGHAELDLGEGLQVHELDVLDVDTLEAWVEVRADAPPGARDVTIRGVHATAVFTDAFEVRDAASALHVVSVSPQILRQGQSVDLRVELSEPFGQEVTVRADEALLVRGTPTVEDHTVSVPLAVGGSATPGDYVLVLDDGQTRLPVEIEVHERTIEGTQRACAHVDPMAPAGLLAGVLLVMRRRFGRPTASASRRRSDPKRDFVR